MTLNENLLPWSLRTVHVPKLRRNCRMCILYITSSQYRLWLNRSRLKFDNNSQSKKSNYLLGIVKDHTLSLYLMHRVLHIIGPVVLSTPAQLVAPVIVARGTLSITTTEIYFEVDEDDPSFKRLDSTVSPTATFPFGLICDYPTLLVTFKFTLLSHVHV